MSGPYMYDMTNEPQNHQLDIEESSASTNCEKVDEIVKKAQKLTKRRFDECTAILDNFMAIGPKRILRDRSRMYI